MLRKTAAVASLTLAMLTVAPVAAWADPPGPGGMGGLTGGQEGFRVPNMPGAFDRSGSDGSQSFLTPQRQPENNGGSAMGNGDSPMSNNTSEESPLSSGNGLGGL
ncbi:hypothetical protein NGB36_30215 [Streptomyces sp. RB6PN25]|uniref:Uncharacterized protein n=1 Tax=Streptomyces humicola TaxID=2953240 RepID=A0ABT1Q480_9ACTN|nr:hypothetical protein [Streptomyces humicola]MCQ4084736.1 hypothetical protein [Streptomyces humicola]